MTKLIYSNILLLLACDFVILVSGNKGNQQSFEIWSSESSCDDDDDPRWSLQESGQVTIPIDIPTVYIRLNGLWGMETCASNGDKCTEWKIKASEGEICQRLGVGSANKILKIVRFGKPNQDGKEINFFTESNLRGQSLQFDKGSDKATMQGLHMQVRSFYYTGVNKWKINGECFDGTSTSVQNKGYGFTHNFNTEFTLNNLQFGCDDTDTEGSGGNGNPNGGGSNDESGGKDTGSNGGGSNDESGGKDTGSTGGGGSGNKTPSVNAAMKSNANIMHSILIFSILLFYSATTRIL